MTDKTSIFSEVQSHELVSWPRVAAISAMVAFSLPTFITGIEVYVNSSVTTGIYALVIASLLLTVIGALMGAIGGLTRMSSYLLVRVAFGEYGAALVNLAFAISLVGWFGVNLDLFAQAIQQLCLQLFQVTIPAWPVEIAAGGLMISTTIFGFKAINILASMLVPVLALVTFLMLFGAMDKLSFSEFFLINKAATLSLSAAVGAIVGAIIIGAIILPDITRFCKHWSGGIYTAICAFMVVQFLVLVVASFSAAAMGIGDVLELMLAIGLGIGAFIIVIAGSWILNSLNLYSTMLSIEAVAPSYTGKFKTIIIGALGVIAAFFNILDQFISFLIVLATVFIPVCGIIIVDFFFLNRKAYQFNQLKLSKRISWPAIFAWSVGAMYATLAEFGIIGSISSISSVDAIILSATIHLIGHKLPLN